MDGKQVTQLILIVAVIVVLIIIGIIISGPAHVEADSTE